MDRNVVKIIQNRAEDAIKKAFAVDPMLSHFKISAAGGKIGAIDTTLKFQFVDTKTKAPAEFTGTLGEDSVLHGGAAAGTEVMFGGKLYSIIRARRSKYEALSKLENKVFLLPFSGCRAVPKTGTVLANDTHRLPRNAEI